MRYCQKHRGLETAEEGICEVAGALLLAQVESPCELVDTLVIVKEDGEWPDEIVNRFADAWHTGPVNLLVFIRRGFDALAAVEPGET